jgi:cytochrome c oxidase subunit 4
MAKDEDKKPEDEKDAFTDSDEKAATPAETVASKRSTSSKPPAKAEAEEGPADDDDSDSEAEEEEESSEDASNDEEQEDEEDEAPAAAAKPARSTPPADAYRQSAKKDDDHDHGFAHVVSLKILGGVLGSLIVLTILTVAAANVDLGAEWNLVVAMVIATIKAGLVVTFFMHLLWDKKFNLLIFLSGVLFVILFISLALTDRKEYQPLIDQREAAQAQAQTQ